MPIWLILTATFRMSNWPPSTVSGVILLIARLAAIVVFGLIAATHPGPFATGQIDSATTPALWSEVVFMLTYFVVDLIWGALLQRDGTGTSPEIASTWGPFVALIVTTAGVVLGLLQVFGAAHLTFSLKLAVTSLVVSVAIGMILFGLVVSDPPKGAPALALRAFVFNVTLWAFGLGLFSIGWSLIYR